VRDEVLREYKIAGKNYIFHIILYVLNSKQEEKGIWIERWQVIPEINLLLISS